MSDGCTLIETIVSSRPRLMLRNSLTGLQISANYRCFLCLRLKLVLGQQEVGAQLVTGNRATEGCEGDGFFLTLPIEMVYSGIAYFSY